VQANAVRATKREAVAAARAKLEEKLKRSRLVNHGELFEDLAGDYFELGADSLSPTTHYGYRRIYERHLCPHFEGVVVSKIDPTAVLRYRKAKHHGLASSTVHQHMIVLGNILDFGVRTRRLQYNAAEAVRERKATRSARERRPLTEDEARLLLSAALIVRDEPDPPAGRKRDWRYAYALIAVSTGTGLRRGELLGLRREDLDLDAGVMSLVRNLVQVPGEGKTLKETKGRRETVRVIAMPEYVVAALRAELRRQAPARLRDPDWNPEGYVFPNAAGRPRHPDAVTHVIAALLERCGIDGADLHGMRHTHSTVLQAHEIDSEVIRNRQGHVDIATTRGYMHAAVEAQAPAVRVLQAAFGETGV